MTDDRRFFGTLTEVRTEGAGAVYITIQLTNRYATEEFMDRAWHLRGQIVHGLMLNMGEQLPKEE